MSYTLLFIALVYCVAYMFLNFFSFYQVVRPLGRKSVNKYLYLYALCMAIVLSSLEPSFIKTLALIVLSSSRTVVLTDATRANND